MEMLKINESRKENNEIMLRNEFFLNNYTSIL